MTNTELQVVIEAKREDPRRATQSVWDGLQQALKDREPKLQRAEIVNLGMS